MLFYFILCNIILVPINQLSRLKGKQGGQGLSLPCSDLIDSLLTYGDSVF